MINFVCELLEPLLTLSEVEVELAGEAFADGALEDDDTYEDYMDASEDASESDLFVETIDGADPMMRWHLTFSLASGRLKKSR